MIKCKNGAITIIGGLEELHADISTLVFAINKELSEAMGEENAKMFIQNCVDMGFMSNEEIEEGLKKLFKEMKEDE